MYVCMSLQRGTHKSFFLENMFTLSTLVLLTINWLALTDPDRISLFWRTRRAGPSG